MLRRAVVSEAPGRDCRVILDESAAMRAAIEELETGDVVVVFYEKLDPALSLLKQFDAKPAKSVPRLFYSAESFCSRRPDEEEGDSAMGRQSDISSSPRRPVA